MQSRFNLGKVTVKDEAVYALTLSGLDTAFFLEKHASGDWGSEDPELNERGLREGSMVLSRYRTLRGHEILVTTFLAKQETYLFCPPNSVIKYVEPYDPVPRLAANPEAFKYDASHGDIEPWPPWYKAGLPEPKKSDPGEPKGEQP